MFCSVLFFFAKKTVLDGETKTLSKCKVPCLPTKNQRDGEREWEWEGKKEGTKIKLNEYLIKKKCEHTFRRKEEEGWEVILKRI